MSMRKYLEVYKDLAQNSNGRARARIPRRLRGDKRGNASDVAFFAGVGFLTVFFGLLISHYVFTTIVSNLVGIAPFDTGVANDVLQKITAIYNNLDWISIVVLVGVVVTLIITSWFVAGHPALTIAYFFVVFFSVFISAVVANFWEDATTGGFLSSSLTHFPIADHIMLNLPLYIAIIGFIGMVVTFAKPTPNRDVFI